MEFSPVTSVVDEDEYLEKASLPDLFASSEGENSRANYQIEELNFDDIEVPFTDPKTAKNFDFSSARTKDCTPVSLGEARTFGFKQRYEKIKKDFVF